MSVRESEKQELPLKVIFVGPSYAGKTSLLNRIARNQFGERYLATIGCDFLSKYYNLYNRKVKAQFWDTAGQQRFGNISAIFYKKTDAILLCYNLNDNNSFKQLEFWMEELNKHKVDKNNTVFVVVGCKKDLEINVPTDAVLQFLKERALMHFETSAKTGEGVEEMMKAVIEESAMRKMRQLQGQLKLSEKGEIQELNRPIPPKKSCSC